MKIPGIIYLIVGILVIVVSSFMENFSFFIFVGIIFTAIGLIKLITRQSKKEINEPEFRHEEKVFNPKSKDLSKYVICKYCKAYNYPNTKFCHYCGRRMI